MIPFVQPGSAVPAPSSCRGSSAIIMLFWNAFSVSKTRECERWSEKRDVQDGASVAVDRYNTAQGGGWAGWAARCTRARASASSKRLNGSHLLLLKEWTREVKRQKPPELWSPTNSVRLLVCVSSREMNTKRRSSNAAYSGMQTLSIGLERAHTPMQ